MNNETISHAIELLRNGDVIAFPTETVYGLGANAFDTSAVLKIFELKRRPQFDPLIVHIPSIDDIVSLVIDPPSIVFDLADHFLPGPLTLVCHKRSIVPDLVTSGLSTVAIRIPSHPIAQKLLREFGKPIAAPSANLFGKLSPTRAEHVHKSLGNRLFVIDGGESSVGIESTILDVTRNPPVLLRQGGISQEEIEHVIGTIEKDIQHSSNPKVPGQLPHHYSPNTPLVVLHSVESILKISIENYGVLLPSPSIELPSDSSCKAIRFLSTSGDVREMAINFFSMLHELDDLNLDTIFAVQVPEIGIGNAINDRLKRASYQPREDENV